MMIGIKSRPVVAIPETKEEGRQALLPARASTRRVKVKAGCRIEQTAHLDRTLLTALLLGPTGLGKTETARAMAEALYRVIEGPHAGDL